MLYLGESALFPKLGQKAKSILIDEIAKHFDVPEIEKMEVFHARNITKLFVHSEGLRTFAKYVQLYLNSTSKSELLLA